MADSLHAITHRIRTGDATVKDADMLEEVIFSLITDLIRLKHQDAYALAGKAAQYWGHA